MEPINKFANNTYPMPKEVHMFTDGACSGNHGDGAYCCILQCKQHEKIISDYAEYTTNNKMELLAVIKGLEAIKYPCKIDITSDSKYVVDGVTKWLPNWKANGWRDSNNKTIKNIQLWQRLDDLIQEQDSVTFHWIKGHNQHFYNCKCDEIARGLIAQNRLNKQDIIDNNIEDTYAF